MSTQPIASEVIEAAAQALFGDAWDRAAESYRDQHRRGIEAAIRAADEKRGIRVEHQADRPGYVAGVVGQRRYVSDWHDVEDSS